MIIKVSEQDLSVSAFLRLGSTGKTGYFLPVIGALIIRLHAPDDKNVTSVKEFTHYTQKPG